MTSGGAVTQIDFLVEEPSMETLFRGLVPGLIPGVPFEVFPFRSKDDLLKNLPARLRGYASWNPPGRVVLVMVDRDDDDCLALKSRLETCAVRAGLSTRTTPQEDRVTVITRIVIEELEAWYFGDWEAVRAAYPRVSATIPQKRSFRDPDAIAGGTWEAFERVLQRAGYFPNGLSKIQAARALAPNLEPGRNTSRSFQVFRDAITSL